MAKSAPWAKLGMLRTPVISDRPRPIRAYSMPVAIPFRTCPRNALKKPGLPREPRGRPSERADILAGRVFLGQRRVSGGDYVAEVELVLHRGFGLAAEQEVGAQRLVRGAVDSHRADDVVHFQALERLYHGLHVFGLCLVVAV